MFSKIKRLDEAVVRHIIKIHRPVLDRVMVAATYAGTGAVIWSLALFLPFVITRRYRLVGFDLMLSVFVTFVLSEIIIKKIIGRDRPSEKIDDDDMIIKKPQDHSFPSGHTSTSFAAFTVTFICCPAWIWIPALFGACLISFSRLYLRVHYLSDVLVGVVVGVGCGVLCTAVFNHFFSLL